MLVPVKKTGRSVAERDTSEPLRMGFGQESDYEVLRFSQPRPKTQS